MLIVTRDTLRPFCPLPAASPAVVIHQCTLAGSAYLREPLKALVSVPVSYSVNTDKLILKFIRREKTQKSPHNTEGKEPSWRTDSTRLEVLMSSHSNGGLVEGRQTDVLNRRARLEIDPPTQG